MSVSPPAAGQHRPWVPSPPIFQSLMPAPLRAVLKRTQTQGLRQLDLSLTGQPKATFAKIRSPYMTRRVPSEEPPLGTEPLCISLVGTPSTCHVYIHTHTHTHTLLGKSYQIAHTPFRTQIQGKALEPLLQSTPQSPFRAQIQPGPLSSSTLALTFVEGLSLSCSHRT